jgi:hypothetical protein
MLSLHLSPGTTRQERQTMNQITASFESAARAAHTAAFDAFAATVLERYWDDNEFAAAVNAVATYTAATAAGSKKIATIIAFRELFGICLTEPIGPHGPRPLRGPGAVCVMAGRYGPAGRP